MYTDTPVMFIIFDERFILNVHFNMCGIGSLILLTQA